MSLGIFLAKRSARRSNLSSGTWKVRSVPNMRLNVAAAEPGQLYPMYMTWSIRPFACESPVQRPGRVCRTDNKRTLLCAWTVKNIEESAETNKGVFGRNFNVVLSKIGLGIVLESFFRHRVAHPSLGAFVVFCFSFDSFSA